MAVGVHQAADRYAAARQHMVQDQLVRRAIHDSRVLQAMADVPRERFVSAELAPVAYDDCALPAPLGQSVSQPYIVALMLELAQIRPVDRVLDVGTGSGYAAAVASRLAAQVWGVERLPELAGLARERLAALGCDNVQLRTGDGAQGWPDHAPYDAILVAAAAATVPPALLAQVAPGGRLVMPLGQADGQRLVCLTRSPAGWQRSDAGSVNFVPLIEDRRLAHAEPVS